MAGKNIQLEEEAISEILVADTASELGAEASVVVDGQFEEEEEEEEEDDDDDSKPQQKSPYQTVASEPDCAVICVLLAAKERAHSVPDVTWACAWCLVLQNITQKQICNHPHCEYCVS